MNRFIPPRSRGFFSSGFLYLCGESKPCLDAGSEGAEVADARDFVIRELDAEVIFEARKQFERLQAIDSQLLVEIVAWLEGGARDFEVCRRQIQDFIRCFLDCVHDDLHFTLAGANDARLRQVWMRAGIFDELAQSLHHGRPHEEFTENVDLVA